MTPTDDAIFVGALRGLETAANAARKRQQEAEAGMEARRAMRHAEMWETALEGVRELKEEMRNKISEK